MRKTIQIPANQDDQFSIMGPLDDEQDTDPAVYRTEGDQRRLEAAQRLAEVASTAATTLAMIRGLAGNDGPSRDRDIADELADAVAAYRATGALVSDSYAGDVLEGAEPRSRHALPGVRRR